MYHESNFTMIYISRVM